MILADPPWTFKTYSKKGLQKSPENHYSCMSLEEICEIPVPSWAADDCALFLWCTWPTLVKGTPLKVIDAWGFKASGLAWEWLKYNDKTGKYAFGTGYITRKNVEPCIVATRGKPKLLSRSERDFIIAPRRDHSRKPDEQYARIERMYAGDKLEMFARQQWPGWATWGNQTTLFDCAAE